MKKTFLSVLFSVVIIISFSSSVFAEPQNSNDASPTSLTIVPLGHGMDY